MTSPFNAIATALYNILKADAPLVTALGGTAANRFKIYHIIAPQRYAVPYITYGQITDIPLGDFNDPTTIEQTTWYINCFSKTGSKDAGAKAVLVTSVLDNATLTVAGFNELWCLREFIGSPIYDPETTIYLIPLRYSIWVNNP